MSTRTISRDPEELRDYAQYLDRVGKDYAQDGREFTAADYAEAARITRHLADLLENGASK